MEKKSPLNNLTTSSKGDNKSGLTPSTKTGQSLSNGGNNYELLIFGGSAGSVHAIGKLLSEIPQDFPLPILIVIHRLASSESTLADVFQSKTELPLKDAQEKEKIISGNIYLGPANYHLLIEDDKTISLDDSEKVNFSRPSIDVTFEQASEVYKDKLIAVLLTGANADGAEGLLTINKNGGFTIVQSPASSEFPTMPKAAISLSNKHTVLDLDNIIPFILQKIF